ncbi:MAG: glutamate-cysteine ligase family protein [Pseudonocardia sp.]
MRRSATTLRPRPSSLQVDVAALVASSPTSSGHAGHAATRAAKCYRVPPGVMPVRSSSPASSWARLGPTAAGYERAALRRGRGRPERPTTSCPSRGARRFEG